MAKELFSSAYKPVKRRKGANSYTLIFSQMIIVNKKTKSLLIPIVAVSLFILLYCMTSDYVRFYGPMDSWSAEREYESSTVRESDRDNLHSRYSVFIADLLMKHSRDNAVPIT